MVNWFNCPLTACPSKWLILIMTNMCHDTNVAAYANSSKLEVRSKLALLNTRRHICSKECPIGHPGENCWHGSEVESRPQPQYHGIQIQCQTTSFGPSSKKPRESFCSACFSRGGLLGGEVSRVLMSSQTSLNESTDKSEWVHSQVWMSSQTSLNKSTDKY